MKLTQKEIDILALTINPTVEYYRALASSPIASSFDINRFEVLNNLQKKLDSHSQF